MSKKENVKTKSTEYKASYKLAARDKITFYCSNVSGGNVVGKSITNHGDVTMKIVYCNSDKSLYLVDLSGDIHDA